MSSEGKMQVFGAFHQRKRHASKDGVLTLCGIKLDRSWREYESDAWSTARKCRKCAALYPRVLMVGKQATSDGLLKER